MISCRGGTGSADRVTFYDASIDIKVAGTTYATSWPGGAASATHFYLNDGTTSTTGIKKYDANGNLVSTISVSGSHTSPNIGVAQDGSFAVWTQIGIGYLYRIDLPSGTPTLIADETGAGYSITTNPGTVLVLQDNTIVVIWFQNSTTSHLSRYNSAGTLLWSTTITTGISGAAAQMCLGADASVFYLGFDEQLTSGPSTGTVTFYAVNASTGVLGTALFSKAWPSSGDSYNLYDNSAMFLWIYNEVIPPTPPTTPPAVLVNSDQCCCDGTPGPTSEAGPLPDPIGPTWTPACTGSGTVPSASDVVLAEAWDY